MSRVVLVADGMSKLGVAICIKLATLGYRIVTTHAPDNTEADTWLAAMKAAGRDFRAYPYDAGDEVAVRCCVAAIENEIGPIDIFVNNAVYAFISSCQKIDKPNDDARPRVASGAIRQVCDGMLKRGWGRIINIPVQNGKPGQSGQAECSNDGIDAHNAMMAWASEVTPQGVTVNTVSPACSSTSTVATEQVQQKTRSPASSAYLDQAEEIAGLVAYLASDEAAFLNGAHIVINGDADAAK